MRSTEGAAVSLPRANRFLYAWVMFGRDLSTGLRTKAEAVLSTLEVDPPE